MNDSHASAGETRMLAQWFGVLGPPVIWAVRFGLIYTLVPYACWWDSVFVLHLTTILALIGTAAAGWFAWREWSAAGPSSGEDPEPGTRSRFMGLLGMFNSAFFSLVIAAEGLANVMIDPCQQGGVPLA